MGQARHKGVWQSLGHNLTVAVLCLVSHVEHRFFYVAHSVAQQVDGNHGQAIAVAVHVFRVLVLHAQILAETQRLGL